MHDKPAMERGLAFRWNETSQHILVWLSAFFLALLSYDRQFGTDVENYIGYFKDIESPDSLSSLEPLYVAATHLAYQLGLGRTAVIEVAAWASIALLCVYCCRQKHPLASLLICLGWLLFQQFWGTIRMGLGICFLLFANYIALHRRRIPWWTWIAPAFHWSLALNPLLIRLRVGPRWAILIAVVAFLAVSAIGSIREIFFLFVPSSLEAIANYSALQLESASRFPPLMPLLIHIALVFAITRATNDAVQRAAFLGPLTILYCATCLFYDFDQAGSRAANILISVKIIALIHVYDYAERVFRSPTLVRAVVLSYSSLVAIQYWIANAEYF